MSRSPIVVRDAEPSDAAVLVGVWSEPLRRTSADRASGPPLAEVRASILSIAADPKQRLVVALCGDEVIGAAVLSATSVSPLHAEDAVQISHLQVCEPSRRDPAGKALVTAALSWAEERGLGTVLALAPAHDREANRDLARLGFSSLGTLRAASVTALRAGMMPVEPPACARVDVRTNRTVGQVLAQRRMQRRVKSTAATAD